MLDIATHSELADEPFAAEVSSSWKAFNNARRGPGRLEHKLPAYRCPLCRVHYQSLTVGAQTHIQKRHCFFMTPE